MATAPGFWWLDHPSAAALALWPASRLWSGVAARRLARPATYWAPAPVICVGNYTVGGEGKTPTAIALGRLIASEGLRPGFIIRGYGGSLKGPVVVDPARHGAAEVGDEALLLARSGLTVMSRDRPAGARLLCERGAEMIVMDDGFQNPSLGKDAALVVADAATGIGNGLNLPAGPLRAPLRVQLARTTALILIGEGEATGQLVRLAARAGRRVLRARLEPVGGGAWRRDPVLAYAGIGRPEKFFRTLEAEGAKFAGRLPFPDHHVFTEAEAAMLLARAETGSFRLVTTEKDYARLGRATGTLARLRDKTEVFAVRLVFEDEAAIRALIRTLAERVARRGGAAARAEAALALA